MADLQGLIAYRDALEDAYYGGLREVEYDGRQTTWQSGSEMRRALADLNRQIRKLQGQPSLKEVRISSSKGL